MPVEKQTPAVGANAVLADRSCMLYSGSMVTAGQGTAVVVATGRRTEIGRISGLLDSVETITTPLLRQMTLFARWLSVLILVVAGLLLIYGYFVAHFPFSEMFMAVVGLSVAAIPEGLPAVLTITLATGVRAMAKRQAVVRQLPAIETIGAVSVICTDKTGTLTRNEMVVVSAITANQCFSIDGIGYQPQGAIHSLHSPAEKQAVSEDKLNEIALAAALCNDAVIAKDQGVWSVNGDPMEGALLAFAEKSGSPFALVRKQWPRTDAVPFDTKHRFMATLNHDHEGNAYAFLKGAPEQIVTMCQRQRAESGEEETLNPAYWTERADDIAKQGQRVLAFASKQVQVTQTVLTLSDLQEGLIFLGMVGLIDPPRTEAIDAVKACRDAGIRVKMITGDHPGTAMAIGKDIGLQNFNAVLTGKDIDAMDNYALATAVLDCDIFARTSPEHKLRLVTALQTHDLVVAMTGDGFNDAPALKRADVGIAMGKKGSEAAKESAEIVLADDNFASIIAAVREGRTVYDNLKKVISWTLPTSAGEAMTIIVALLMGLTLPVTPIQILWINLITATTLGVALAFEPTEANTMRRPPRQRNESLLTGALVWHIVFVSILFLCGVFGIYFYAIDRGFSVDLARTLAMNTLVTMEIFHLFFIRNLYGTSLTWKAVRGTRVVWITIAVVTVAQFCITYLGTFQKIFATEAVPLLSGFIVVLIGIALFVIIELEKQIRLHR